MDKSGIEVHERRQKRHVMCAGRVFEDANYLLGQNIKSELAQRE
jgi:hypothetical protein